MARILVIDDDESIRIALRKMLEGAGHEVVEASEGAHGMRLYKEAPTSVVITDILMPEKEGFEVIRELRRANPDVRIIAISGGLGRGGPDFLPQANDLGATSTLAKPFTREQLLSTLAKVLEDQSESGSDESPAVGKRVLIVDDDPEILAALKRLFESRGHSVETVTTSEDGVAFYQKDPTDVVITDIFVPVDGGLEVIRKLKQSHPDSKIVAITGFGIRDELDAVSLAKQMGADLAYEKPMDFERFLDEVEALLQ